MSVTHNPPIYFNRFDFTGAPQYLVCQIVLMKFTRLFKYSGTIGCLLSWLCYWYYQNVLEAYLGKTLVFTPYHPLEWSWSLKLPNTCSVMYFHFLLSKTSNQIFFMVTLLTMIADTLMLPFFVEHFQSQMLIDGCIDCMLFSVGQDSPLKLLNDHTVCMTFDSAFVYSLLCWARLPL